MKKARVNKYSIIFFSTLLISITGFCKRPVPLQKSAAAVITALKKSAAKVVLSDGSLATSSTVMINRKWNGNLCELSVKNISPKPLSIREVIVFDIQHGLNSNTPVYGESFQKLGQVGGTLGKPEDWGTYADRSHYKIPEPENLRTAYGMLTLQVQQNDRFVAGNYKLQQVHLAFLF